MRPSPPRLGRGGGRRRPPCRSLREVFAAAQGGRAPAGIVPVENSFAGSINETYDLLLESPLHIVAEVTHRVDHCLLALSGETLATVERVLSHPQALAQCETFLREHRLQPVPEYDTAGAGGARAPGGGGAGPGHARGGGPRRPGAA